MRSFCRFLLFDRPPKRSDVRGSDESVARSRNTKSGSGSRWNAAFPAFLPG
jgi:hypothetical protein